MLQTPLRNVVLLHAVSSHLQPENLLSCCAERQLRASWWLTPRDKIVCLAKRFCKVTCGYCISAEMNRLGIGPYLWNPICEPHCLLLILPQSAGVFTLSFSWPVLFYFIPNLATVHGDISSKIAWRGKQCNPLQNNCPWANWWILKLINVQLGLSDSNVL